MLGPAGQYGDFIDNFLDDESMMLSAIDGVFSQFKSENPSDTDTATDLAFQPKQENFDSSGQALLDAFQKTFTGRAISHEQNEEAYPRTLPHNYATYQNHPHGIEFVPLNSSTSNEHLMRSSSIDDYMGNALLASIPVQSNFDSSSTSVDNFSPMNGPSNSTWCANGISPTMTRDLPTTVTTNGSLSQFPSYSGMANNAAASHSQYVKVPRNQGISDPRVFTASHQQGWPPSQAIPPNWLGDHNSAIGYGDNNRSAGWGFNLPVDHSQHKSLTTASTSNNTYPSSLAPIPSNTKPALYHQNGPGEQNLEPQNCIIRPYPNQKPFTTPTSAQVPAYPTLNLDKGNFSSPSLATGLKPDSCEEMDTTSEVQRHKDIENFDDAQGMSNDDELVYFDAFGRPVCPDCGDGKPLKLKVKTDPEQDRCKRHWDAHCKTLLGPPTYSMDPEVPDAIAARNELFPAAAGLEIADDDWRDQNEDYWVAQFFDAINRPYSRGTPVAKIEDHVWLKDQQTEFNRKPGQQTSVERGSYTNRAITARLRLLYMCAMNYHQGGQIPYPTGGDNWGYDEDRQMICSHRMRRIADFLSTDKRICMNVIEGRGVYAFAKNPDNYAMRKATNSRSNTKKKALISKGKAKGPEAEFRRVGYPTSATESGDRRPRKRARFSEEQGSMVFPNRDAYDLTEE